MKVGHSDNNFLELEVYMRGKRCCVKIHLLNILKGYDILVWTGPTTIGNDRWRLYNVLWMKLSDGKFSPRLSGRSYIYQYELSCAMFFAISALGISWQHLNHINFLVRSAYQFHVYFHGTNNTTSFRYTFARWG